MKLDDSTWSPHHSMSSFLTKAEYDSYIQGFYEAIKVTASHEMLDALQSITEEYDSEDNGRTLRWAIDDARKLISNTKHTSNTTRTHK